MRGIALGTLDFKQAVFSSQVHFFFKIHAVRNSDWFSEFHTPHIFVYIATEFSSLYHILDIYEVLKIFCHKKSLFHLSM